MMDYQRQQAMQQNMHRQQAGMGGMQGQMGFGSQGSLQQMGGQGSMSPQTFGALSNPGGMDQIPAYARAYFNNQGMF